MNNILPPTNLVNPSNSHFSDPNPQFSSRVGVVDGCVGSLTSDLALKQKGMYHYMYNGGKRRNKSKKLKKSKKSKKSKRKYKKKTRKQKRRV
jgi:hypothetical protein